MRSFRNASRKLRRFPMTMRDFVADPATARRPAVKAGHVGLGPGLIDEDQPRWIDAPLMSSPTLSMAAYIRAVPLARNERLFLNVTPRWRRKRLISDVSALTPRSPPSRSHSA